MGNPLPQQNVFVIDLQFQAIPGAIATYLIPHPHGAVLVESGPASTLPELREGLKRFGMNLGDISDVLLTHIHLDHAGAAGYLAREGARIHVHPVGAAHLADPARLLNSAQRLYGDKMDELWGETIPVPADQILNAEGGQVIEIEGLTFQVMDTPGHAWHHNAYKLGGICFSGDVGGVRLSGLNHVRAPTVPPEFQPQVWRESLAHLAEVDIQWIAPTHYGFFDDPDWQLAKMDAVLGEVMEWMEANLSDAPDIDLLEQRYNAWIERTSQADELTAEQIRANEAANPSWLSPLGIQRYWNKNK